MDEGKPGAGRGGALTGAVLPESPNWVDVTGLYVQEGMLAFAVLQFLLGIAGTIALIVTLRESRRATATALKALHVQQSAERAVLVISETKIVRSALRKSDRAWLDPSELIALTPDSVLEAEVRLVVQIKNVGRTVALVLSKGCLFDQGAVPSATILEGMKVQKHQPVDVDGTIVIRSRLLSLNSENLQKCLAGEEPLWFMGRVDYEDIFGEPHELQFTYTTDLKGISPKLEEYESQDHWIT